jgi:hypothetical protein
MYPGTDVVDVAGQDIYAKTADEHGFSQAAYEDLTKSAPGKAIALTEVGLAPGSEVLSKQNHSYLLMWGGFEKNVNKPPGLRALYDSPRAVNQGDPMLGTHVRASFVV